MGVYRRPVGGGLNASNEKNETQQAATGAKNRLLDADYLNQIKMLVNGMGNPGGGMGGMSFGGGGGGGGRGGGGGGFDYGAEQRRRQAELAKQKLILTQQLQQARAKSLPMLRQYGRDYNTQIGNIFAQNRGLTSGYNKQLASLARQMNTGINNEAMGLRNDMMHQGANGPEMQAMLAANRSAMAGNDFLRQNGQGYNTRLAQMMAAAQADSKSMGAAIKASSLGQLENSYATLLAQIGMLGLGA